ncbi:MAG: pyridoxal phosphate-dependent aminotransferase [Candidatus Paracaedimonas acanthamoebae]|uniref:Aminotransferase n=1 Tax=Candidatus Paracaedimonas acanthamoebae TaxID=244581 RepID=A0A8J7PVE4_9PROT|nr:pyridoxal phosphate-dependent aminotransferase [Candidatus Paracaedimonas acanthamoebae]
MLFISDRLKSVKPSSTLSLSQKASELKAQGHDIISLTTGELDFPTPSWICEAACEAMMQGDLRYTAVGGTPVLKQAIIEKFRRENHLDYKPYEIIASTGAKQSIFNAFLATIGPNDEVIVPAPYWVSYLDIVYLAEGKPIIIDCPQEDQFKITPQALEKSITPRTKWLILNSPSNPTGAIYTKAELKAIAEVLLKHPHVMILSDDIYEHVRFNSEPFTAIASLEPHLKERTLTLNGVSKSYGMTGWRLGYAGGPQWLIQAMTNIQSHSTSSPSAISQAAAVAALNGPQTFLENWNKTLQERRNVVFNEMKQIKEFSCVLPEGAFYMYINCQNVIGKSVLKGEIINSDQDFASYLLEAYGIAVVPGSAFGLSPYFRLSYATDLAKLRIACERIKKAVSELQD